VKGATRRGIERTSDESRSVAPEAWLVRASTSQAVRNPEARGPRQVFPLGSLNDAGEHRVSVIGSRRLHRGMLDVGPAPSNIQRAKLDQTSFCREILVPVAKSGCFRGSEPRQVTTEA